MTLLPKPVSRRGRHSTRAQGDAAELAICADLEAAGLPAMRAKQTADGFKREDIIADGFLIESKATRIPRNLEAHLEQAESYNNTIYQMKLLPVVVISEGTEKRCYMDFETWLDMAVRLHRGKK